MKTEDQEAPTEEMEKTIGISYILNPITGFYCPSLSQNKGTVLIGVKAKWEKRIKRKRPFPGYIKLECAKINTHHRSEGEKGILSQDFVLLTKSVLVLTAA